MTNASVREPNPTRLVCGAACECAAELANLRRVWDQDFYHKAADDCTDILAGRLGVLAASVSNLMYHLKLLKDSLPAVAWSLRAVWSMPPPMLAGTRVAASYHDVVFEMAYVFLANFAARTECGREIMDLTDGPVIPLVELDRIFTDPSLGELRFQIAQKVRFILQNHLLSRGLYDFMESVQEFDASTLIAGIRHEAAKAAAIEDQASNVAEQSAAADFPKVPPTPASVDAPPGASASQLAVNQNTVVPPPPPEPNYLYRREGGVYRVRFDGETGLIPATLKGASYIFELLQRQNKSIPATELHAIAAGVNKKPDSGNRDHQEKKRANCVGQDQGELLDLRSKLQEINRDLDHAKEDNNNVEIQHCEEQKELINAKIRGSLGLGGRLRVNSKKDSIRSAVGQRITDLIKKLHEGYNMPKLASHLKEFIDRGSDCSYRPTAPVPNWQF